MVLRIILVPSLKTLVCMRNWPLHQAIYRTPSSTESTAQAYNQGHQPAPQQEKLGKLSNRRNMGNGLVLLTISSSPARQQNI